MSRGEFYYIPYRPPRCPYPAKATRPRGSQGSRDVSARRVRGVEGGYGGAEPQGTRGKALKSGVVGRHATSGERGGQSRVGGRLRAGSGSESRGQEGCEERLVTPRTLLTVRAVQPGVPGVDVRAAA